MADADNTILLLVDEPADDPLWRSASPDLRRRFYQYAAETARALKLARLRKGEDVWGQPMVPVLSRSRRDRAAGPPLSPHRSESRTQKWLRASVGQRAKTIRLWWSHGWGRILDYHRAGVPRAGGAHGVVVRDVIGFQEEDEQVWRAALRRFWVRIRVARRSA